MTFTYDPAGLNDTSAGHYAGATKGKRWRVRLRLGDVMEVTTQANRHLEDEEIDFQLAEHGDDDLAGAVHSGEDLLAKWSHRELATVQSGMDTRWENLRRRVEKLRDLWNARAGVAVGGVSVSEKEAAEADPDRVQPSFRREILDNPRALEPDTSPAPRNERFTT